MGPGTQATGRGAPPALLGELDSDVPALTIGKPFRSNCTPFYSDAGNIWSALVDESLDNARKAHSTGDLTVAGVTIHRVTRSHVAGIVSHTARRGLVSERVLGRGLAQLPSRGLLCRSLRHGA